MITWNDFERIEMRVGTIIDAQYFPEARKPAYKLIIDFGEEIGRKKSSAQITKRYFKDELIGKQIVAILNFPTKQIGKFHSDCLVLGTVNNDDVVLLTPDFKVENGLKIS